MTLCFFVSDLHGERGRYLKLLRIIEDELPEAVFVGGDILPSGILSASSRDYMGEDFLENELVKKFTQLREGLGNKYPRIFLILGNDDGLRVEIPIKEAAAQGLWKYIHSRKVDFKRFQIYGYSYVPPTPFLLKDWEKYDVSRYVDPGSLSPEEGIRSFPSSERSHRYETIKNDLEALAGDEDLGTAIFLFHAPPYKTKLDRAALDGKKIDFVPMDVHVGSIAIRRFIEARQPLLTLHGHIHESTSLTGAWRDRIGRTFMFSAAHHGPELALVRFDLENIGAATRELI